MKRWGWEKSIALSVRNTNNLKYLCDKAFFFLVFGVSVQLKMKRYLREKNQLKHSNFSVWLINIKSRKKTQVTKLDLEIFPIFSYYFLEKIKQNDLTSSKPKKFCSTLNCILILVFTSEITGCRMPFSFCLYYFTWFS